MEPDKDKNVEQIVQKAMNASNIERTSINFTANVMSKIENLETQKLKYTPIISNSRWVIIVVCVLVLLISSSFLNFENEFSYFDGLKDQISFDYVSFKFLSKINISSVFLYGILMFGILFGIQIPLIKNYYFKRYNIQ